MNKILVIDDEPYILELLKINLESTGYIVKTMISGKDIINTCLEFSPQIILLDIMLPDIDGLSICKKIKENPALKEIGVILVSAKSEIDDRVLGLDTGADDYITKPFSLKEINSRINALLRRLCPNDFNDNCNNIYSHRDLKFDYINKVAYKNNSPLELTHKELKLLEILILNVGKVVSRDIILDKIWNKEEDSNIGRSLDVYIRKLRLKLDSGNSSYIETIHGRGYKLIWKIDLV